MSAASPVSSPASSVSSPIHAVVLAAGKGVRMRSSLPKVLHRVAGRTLVERVLRAARGAASGETIVVVGYCEDLVRAELERLEGEEAFSGAALRAVTQREQLGTGHAAKTALEQLSCGPDDAVMILPGDVPLLTAGPLKALVAGAAKSGADVAFLSCELADPSGFGRVIRGADGAVRAIVEHKDCTPEQRQVREINSSIYLVRRGFLDEALGSLTTGNAQGEYYLTDIIDFAVRSGRGVKAVIADPLELSGANNRAELSDLEQQRRLQIARELLESGVTLEDPRGVIVDEGVEVGRDAFLGAGTRLLGKTRIGEGVVIEGPAIIRDSVVGEGAVLEMGCRVDACTIGARAHLGASLNVGPDVTIDEGERIGLMELDEEIEQAALMECCRKGGRDSCAE